MNKKNCNLIVDYLIKRWDKLTARLRRTMCKKTFKYTSKSRNKVLNQIIKMLYIAGKGQISIPEYKLRELDRISRIG